MSDDTNNETENVRKIISAPEDSRGKHLQDVIGDLDMDDLDFVDFYEVTDDPDTLEIRVRGRLKHDLGTTTAKREKDATPPSSSDDAWDRAKGVI